MLTYRYGTQNGDRLGHIVGLTGGGHVKWVDGESIALCPFLAWAA